MDADAPPSVVRPRGITAIGVFFVFGALMAFLAGRSLAKPGTFLDRMWVLNPHAYDELAAALLLTGIGWLKRRRWGGGWR